MRATHLVFRVLGVRHLLAFSLLACAAARGQVPVTIAVDPQTVITPVPTDFEGLSVEASSVQGGTYFYAGNTNLVRLFTTMGVKNLRVGGSTVDSSSTNLSNTDIDHLFGFAQAANLKVIFSFRLQGVNASGSPVANPTDPTIIQSIKQTQYILSNYAANLSCFCIGNEPNTYLGSYSAYIAQWLPYFQAIISAPGCATAPFCGPSSWPTAEGYFVNFRTQFAAGGSSSQYQPNIVFTTQHEYPFGSSTGEAGKTALHDCQKMLINDYPQWYVPLYNKMFPTAGSIGLFPYRLEETNSFSVGGVKGASNAYAAALWSLDYQYWWASQLAGGVNFHTGYHNGNAGANPNAYSAFASASNAADAAQTAWGVGYGLLAFKLGAQGTLVSATTSIPGGTSPAFYLNAYAVLAADRSLNVTIINKDSGVNGNDGRVANVALTLPANYKIVSAQSMSLYSSNVTNTDSITIGGHGINPDGSYTPAWGQISGSFQGNALTTAVPQASATIVKLVAGPAPSAPTGLTTKALSDTQIALNWTSQTSDATAYGVDLSTDNVHWTNLTNSLSPTASQTAGTATYPYIAAGLTPATSYYFRVQCMDAFGTSADSNVASATTGATIGDGIPGWWRAQYFGNGLAVIPGVSGAGDDPNHDGVVNLMAYATGISPVANGGGFSVTTLGMTGSHLTLAFNRLYPAPVGYRVEASPDLVNWSVLATLLAQGSAWTGPAPEFAPVIETGTGSLRTVLVTDPAAMPGADRRFLRLSVF